MKPFLVILVIGAALAGCSKAEPEPTKDDFAAKPRPEGFHGPAATPTGATPPAGATGN